MSDRYEYEIDEKTKEFIVKELGENPSEVNAHIESLRRWVQSMPHLQCPTDAKFLLRFLRVSKFDHIKAQKRIDNFCTVRASERGVPSYFEPYSIDDPIFEEYLNIKLFIPLGKINSGETIVLTRYDDWDLDIFPLVKIIRLFYMTLDAIISEEDCQIFGLKFLFNMHGINKRILESLCDTKVLKYNFIYLSFQTTSLKHDITKLKTVTPGLENILPKEYGGKGGTLDECAERWNVTFRTFYKDGHPFQSIKVDESKRPSENMGFLAKHAEYKSENPLKEGAYTKFENHLLNFGESPKLVQFINCRLCLDSKIVSEDLWIKEGIIQDSEQLFFIEKLSADIIIDCDGALISPGFIDIQVNGGFGFDFSDISQDIETSLNAVGEQLVKFGVTSFCPTIICSADDVYKDILSKTYKFPEGNTQSLGFHIEGPFMSDLKSGMHKKELIKKDFGANPIETLLETYGTNLDNVKYVTLAPEIENSCEVIKYLVNRNICVSLGHSTANFNQGVTAIEAGANMLTHLFCSMNPFHHRDPHLVGLITYDGKGPDSPRIYYGIITDLIHTHPTAIKIAHRSNKDGLIVVTDANSSFGLKDGKYQFGNREIEVVNDKSFVSGTDTLAGGRTPLDQCMRNYWNVTGVSRAEALDAITSHPADALKLGHRKGYLKPGYDADFVILNHDSMEVLSTWISGKIVYIRPQSDLNVRTK